MTHRSIMDPDHPEFSNDDPTRGEVRPREDDHQARADAIAARLGLTVKVAFKGDRCPPWATRTERDWAQCDDCGGVHGDRYRVTLTHPRKLACGCCSTANSASNCIDPGRDDGPRTASLSFDYWASYHDQQTGQRPTTYDVLACVSSDASSPTDPDEVAREYGDMRPSQAVDVAKWAKRLQAFFTADELTALAEVDA